MASIDPELRIRQLARLRAAYEASPGVADDPTENSTARHSRVLLGRILIALSGPHGSTVASARRTNGKACADV